NVSVLFGHYWATEDSSAAKHTLSGMDQVKSRGHSRIWIIYDPDKALIARTPLYNDGILCDSFLSNR
ncbi:hypothetical protein H109_00631, partial [Trichophyton interdigitale MR816]